MYVLNRMSGESVNYNITKVLRVKGKLDIDRLDRALREVTKRHEILRSSFEIGANGPEQVIHPASESRVRTEYAKKGEEEIKVREIVKPFDLSKNELVRVTVIEAVDEEILVIDMPHIITDGISQNRLLKELIWGYEGKEIPSPKIQYQDYVVWQQEQMKSERVEKQKAYWKGQHEGKKECGEIQGDHVRPAVQSYEGGMVELELGEEESNEIRKVCREENVTLFMYLFAGYNILLHKYNGKDDQVVGIPITGRTEAEIEESIGMYINTLALRNEVKREDKVRDILERVKKSTLEGNENQDYPYAALVEELKIERDTSRNPLFDTMFMMQNMEQDAGRIEIKGLEIKEERYRSGTSKFDVVLEIEEREGHIKINIEYACKIYEEESMRRFGARYRKVLQEMLEMGRRVKEIKILNEQEFREVVEENNRTESAKEEYENVIEKIGKIAKEKAANTAVETESEQISYGELERRSNGLAKVLIEAGAKKGHVIGIQEKRGINLIVGILGILKAGCAYMPLDVEYPEERIEYMKKDSGSELLVTEEPGEGKRIRVEGVEGIENGSLNIRIKREDVAYAIYTSGTTGQPKGVVVEHGNVLNLMEGIRERIGINENDKVLCVTMVCFDIFVLESLVALGEGSVVVMAGEEEQRDMDALGRLMNEKGVTVTQMTPSRLELLLRNQRGREALKKQRKVLVGGEELSEKILRRIREVYEGDLYNVYGPTETTVWSSIDKIEGEEITIGRPIVGTQIYIMNEAGDIQGAGQEGEIWIGGKGVTRGYINRAEETKERYVEGRNEGRLYRTGDKGKWGYDGKLRYFGREDNQIKLHGYRIELGEIETRLEETEEVLKAIVKAEKAGEAERLIAYIKGTGWQKDDLRREIEKKLPKYMVPGDYVEVKEFPYTANGKIDRKALKWEEKKARKATGKRTESETEKEIRKMWEDILGREGIGTEENFFDAGGNSLMLIMLQEKLSEKYPRKTTVTTLFSHPTVKGLALFIDADNNLPSLEFNYLELPKQYMKTKKENKKIFGTVTFELQGNRYQKFNNTEQMLDIKTEYASICVFLYVCSIITGKHQVGIQTISSKGVISKLNFNLELYDDLPAFLKVIGPEIERQNTLVPGRYLLKRTQAKENEIASLFYQKDVVALSDQRIYDFDIICSYEKTDGGLRFIIEYNQSAIKVDLIVYLIEQFVLIVESL
jgi:amino acid adenylation domain-containing protein